MTRWLDPDPIEIPASFATLQLAPLIAQTLARRGITDYAGARVFLQPDSARPAPFPGMENAVDRIMRAVRKAEPIWVWGDFDVDGQTSTALLVQTLRAMDADVSYHLPVRAKEGHGMQLESLGSVIDQGATLIITCDTGIAADHAIAYAGMRGVEVIITDHHDPGERLPDTRLIFNPKLLPQDHPLANLAGVGVAYKLAEALMGSFSSRLTPEALLDLVALGLVADVALLQGETRALAQKGIQALRQTSRSGLKAIAKLSVTDLGALTEETISFVFAPRLNALGRLSDANPAVELLLTEDPGRAHVLATQLEALNAQRRLLVGQVYDGARAMLQENPGLLREPAIILSHRDWPGGVVGIVASKLVDLYHKPAILFTETEDGLLRGSARSIDGLQISQAISTQKKFLLSFGGHPMAAGLSLASANLADFRRGFGRAVQDQLGERPSEEPVLQIDAWLALKEVNFELAESMEALAPFGAGNPSLILASRNLTLKSFKELGRGKEHRRVVVADETGTPLELLWWNGADEDLPQPGAKIDLAYSLRTGSYRGQKQLTVELREIRVVEEKPIAVPKSKIEIRDLRADPASLPMARSILCWAEGADKVKGRNRLELVRADEFAVYTTPPSYGELRAALEVVRPKLVYILAFSPPPMKTDAFLEQLAGLAKFGIQRRRGKIRVEELAAVTGERGATVRAGLEWLKAGGHIQIQEEAGELILSAGRGKAEPYLRSEWYVAVRGLLEETAAFRGYLSKADPEAFLKPEA